jgi:acetyl-CoA carboxylase biotin carboxyl carrier protein
VFDEERLVRLIELMKEHDLREVELRDAEQRIRICRAVGDLPGAQAPMSGHYHQAAVSAPPTGAGPAMSVPAVTTADAESDSVVLIKSPMVGTFYTKPNPSAAAYVRVGDHVQPETIVCIIEAMKVFNEIPAEVSGKVVAILVQDEEAVEFGRPLFRVDTRG